MYSQELKHRVGLGTSSEHVFLYVRSFLGWFVDFCLGGVTVHIVARPLFPNAKQMNSERVLWF